MGNDYKEFIIMADIVLTMYPDMIRDEDTILDKIFEEFACNCDKNYVSLYIQTLNARESAYWNKLLY
jgi:hypothetical protein